MTNIQTGKSFSNKGVSMKVAVLCEFSGIVRDAFIKAGHTAISCDLLPTEVPGPHIQGDCRDYDWFGYDLMIAHPPCTYLCSSGARWWKNRKKKQEEAWLFVIKIWNSFHGKKCLENPVGILSTRWRKPDQYIQPWQFGHGECKKTGLWLYGLPKLEPTNIVAGRENRVHKMPQSKYRSKERSRFFPGIAKAMAEQWGNL